MGQTILVIGAGIIGAISAYHLQKGGAQVTVIDAGGANATSASFGWINASFYLDRAHFHLRSDSIAAYRDLAQDLSIPLAWCGCLCWEEVGEAFDTQRDDLRALGYATQEIDQAEFARLEPYIATPPERCLMFRQEGVAEPAGLAETLLQAACARGAQLVSGVTVEAITQSGGRITGVRTNLGEMRADQTLVAAGTGTQALMAAIECPVPMLRRPALMLQTGPVEKIFNHVLVSEIGELRQLPDGSLLMPAAIAHQKDEADQLETTPQDGAAQALERLQALIPKIALHWSRATVAHRPVPQDNLPVAGPAREGLYVATMHSGLTLAAVMGPLIATEMLQGPTNATAERLAPYRPDRFRQ